MSSVTGNLCNKCPKWLVKPNSSYSDYYRPQQSLAKVMFLQVSVILSTGGGVCLSACWDTTHPPGADIPLGADTPRADTLLPLEPGTPPGTKYTPPGLSTPPPRLSTPWD